jgi:hypothetical protein
MQSAVTSASSKHASAKLQVLQAIIDKNPLKDLNVDTMRVINYAIKKLEISNASVRYYAYLVLLAIYK